MAQQLRVFVSPSSHDDAFWRTVVTALRDTGADVWYDEHNLGSGQLRGVILRELGSRPDLRGDPLQSSVRFEMGEARARLGLQAV
jgi:hypothetical protein